MISDTEIKSKGIKALIASLGPTETNRFLNLIDRHPSDYTEWRQLLFEDMTLDEINEKASESWFENHPKESIS